MKNYIQFKDEVAFAFVATDNQVPGLLELSNEVDPESVLGKKYVNGEWVSPEQIRYVKDLSPEGILTGIGVTVYESEVAGEIISDDVKIGYKKVNGEWVDIEKIRASTRPAGFWSWLWDMESASWVPPIPKPQEGSWQWDEDSLGWTPLT